jgi:hypothetical protein
VTVYLAHVLTGSGVHPEWLLVAAGLLALGIIMFVQKSAKPIMSVAVILAGIVVGTGAFVWRNAPSSAQGTRVVITNPKPGDVVPAGKPVKLDVGLQGGSLAASTNATDGGHLHVFVDGKLVNMPATLTPEVRFRPGGRELAVEYVDSAHRSYQPKVIDQIRITAE